MKEVFILLLTTALIVIMWVTHGSTKEARNLDGRILKDSEGNYYQVKANVGDTVFLRKTNIEKF